MIRVGQSERTVHVVHVCMYKMMCVTKFCLCVCPIPPPPSSPSSPRAPEISGDQSTATGEPPVEPSDDIGRDHVTQPAGHVTGDGPTAMAMLDTPFSRARSATVSGGGRPKYRNRKPRKSPAAQADQSHMTSHDSHVTSRDSHVTASSEGVPVTESEVTLVVGERLERKEEEEEEKETSVGGGRTDEQYIMKCQVGRAGPQCAICTVTRLPLSRSIVTPTSAFIS